MKIGCRDCGILLRQTRKIFTKIENASKSKFLQFNSDDLKLNLKSYTIKFNANHMGTKPQLDELHAAAQVYINLTFDQ